MSIPPYDNILEKVIYTDDPEKYIPDIYKKVDNFEKLELNKLRKFKRKEWGMQMKHGMA